MYTFLQVKALLISFASVCFLIKGIVGMSAKNMAQLSATKWNYNLDVTKDLAGRKADTAVGFGLMLISFFLQVAIFFCGLCD